MATDDRGDYTLEELRAFLARAQQKRGSGMSARDVEASLRNYTQGTIPSLAWLRDRIVELERVMQPPDMAAPDTLAPAEATQAGPAYTPEQQFRDVVRLRNADIRTRENLAGAGQAPAEAMAQRGARRDISPADALALGAMQAATFGAGQFQSPEVRGQVRAAREARPGYATMGGLLGGLPQALAAGAVLQPLSLLGRLLGGAALGGAAGAATGALETEGGPQERATGAFLGGGLGLGLGAAGEALTPLAGAGVGRLINRGTSPAQRAAISSMRGLPTELLQSAPEELAALRGTVQGLPGATPVLGDVLPNPLKAAAVASGSQDARRIATDALAERQTFAGPAMAEAVRRETGGGARASVQQTEDLARAARSRVGRETFAPLDAQRGETAVTPEAIQALASDAPVTPEAMQALNTWRPTGDAAERSVELLRTVMGESRQMGGMWRHAQDIADAQGYSLAPIVDVSESGIVQLTGQVPDFGTLQALEHALDGAVRSGFRAGGIEAKKAVGFASRLRTLREGMADLFPDYRLARDAWRRNTDAVEAPRLAQQMLQPRSDVLDARDWLTQASPQGQAMFRVAGRDEIVRMLDLPRVGMNPVKFLRERVGAEKLRLVFGEDAMSRLDEIARGLQRMRGTNAMLRGSDTQPNQALARTFGFDPEQRIPVGRARYVLPRLASQLFDVRIGQPGHAARVNLGAPYMARALTDPNPAAQEAFLALLMRDRNRGLLSVLGEQAPFGLFGAAGQGLTGTFLGRQ